MLIRADLADGESAAQIIEQAVAAMPLGLLVNNASRYVPSDFDGSDGSELDAHWQVNVRAPYMLMAGFARRVERGCIVNVLDTRIASLGPDYFDYTLSRRALADLTRMAARALAPRIRVNGVAPGPILPPAGHGPEFLERVARATPLGVAGRPEEVAEAVSFLVGARCVTGNVIYVDSGQHLTP